MSSKLYVGNLPFEVTDEDLQQLFEAHGTVVGIRANLRLTKRSRNQPIEGHKWFVNSGWQQRSRQLYDVAGEVARTLAAE